MKMHATAAAILDINLLPSTQRPAEVPPIGVAVTVIMAIAVVAMVPLAFKAEAARHQTSTIEDQAQQARRDVHDVQLELTKRRALTSDIGITKAQVTALQKERSLLQGGSRPLSDDLSELWGWGFLPTGGRISAVTGTDIGFRVDGVAPGPLEAIAYADKLVTAGGFKAARLSSFAPAPKDGGQFTVEVTR